MRKKGITPLIIILVIAVIGVFGWIAFTNSYNTPRKATSTPSTIPNPAESGLPLRVYSTENWNTYVNKDKGYSYEYPPIFKTFSDKEENIEWNWFFSNQLGLDSYKKCVDEELLMEGGCLETNNNYIFHLVIFTSSASETQRTGVTYDAFPNWTVGKLSDFQGQGPGLHAEAYTTKGTKNYNVSIIFINILNAEKYLDNYNYSNLEDLFTTILSTFKFTQ